MRVDKRSLFIEAPSENVFEELLWNVTCYCKGATGANKKYKMDLKNKKAGKNPA
jgi:hypothetical protein